MFLKDAIYFSHHIFVELLSHFLILHNLFVVYKDSCQFIYSHHTSRSPSCETARDECHSRLRLLTWLNMLRFSCSQCLIVITEFASRSSHQFLNYFFDKRRLNLELLAQPCIPKYLSIIPLVAHPTIVSQFPVPRIQDLRMSKDFLKN